MFISSAAMLEHWQGHRRLTRRVIDAFPDDKLFEFSIGGMRPFGALALEMLSIGVPMMRGLVTDEWKEFERKPLPKAEILRLWDAGTDELNELWKRIPEELFDQERTAFGQYPGKVYSLVLYAIDNETHHRGQGTVYLRALGIEPPPFYER